MLIVRHVVLGTVLSMGILAAFAGDNGIDTSRVSIEPRRSEVAVRSDIRVDSNLVLIPVSVTDRNHHSVTGLDRGAFRIFEDRRERSVEQFSRDEEALSLGIVFDSSGSMVNKLRSARQAVGEFLKSANPEDEFFLVNFRNQPELAVPFTHRSEEIQNRLIFTESRGKTALLDAVYLALHYMKRAQNPRRALLVISDGGENESRYTQSELRNVVRETDTWIYSVGIFDSTSPVLPEEERGGPQLLTNLARESGGRQFAVERLTDLPEAMAAIGEELRNRYILAYSSSKPGRDGKYHRIQVKLTEHADWHVASRAGYYAPAEH